MDRELGAAAWGVFLAGTCAIVRKVAIKVLQPRIAAATGTEPFLREIRIAPPCSISNVLALIDSGEAATFSTT